MKPKAIIVHQTRDRLRLRVRQKRKDLAFFLEFYEQLRRTPAVEEICMNPTTGSVLVHFDGRRRNTLIGALAPMLRPVARSTMKVGLVALEKGRETAAELGEIFDDLVAEVREEMRMEREAAADAVDGRVAAELSERGSPSEPS